MASAHTKAMKPGRILTVALALVAATFVLAAGCEEQPTIESSGPRGIAPTTTGPADPGAIGHLPPEMAQVYRALTWTKQEEDIWDSVDDYDLQWRETAFFMAMQKVRKVKSLSEENLKLLDYPSYISLMKDPKHYRARPVHLTVYVHRLAKLEPGKHFMASQRWFLSDGSIWRMDCSNAMTKYPKKEPLSVFCAFDPTRQLGKPYEVDEKGQAIYRGVQVEIAGIFYKVYRDTSEGNKKKGIEPEERNYPIVLAWQINAPFTRGGPPSIESRTIMIVLIVAALAAAYLILRRSMKRPVVRHGWRRTYKPIRTIEMGADLLDKETHANQEGDIDPLLKAASEQYRKEKGTDDE